MQAYYSLNGLPIDTLADKVGGKYHLTHLVSQRLRAINGGAPLLVERIPGEALLAVVCREIEQDLISLNISEEGIAVDEDDMTDFLGIEDES